MQDDILIYNTLSRSKEIFSPLEPATVSMYCCGPTVYNYAHIGNLRTYIIQDVMHRVFLWHGFEVKHVMNITDVGHLSSDGDEGEDKVVQAARAKGMSVEQISRYFTSCFFTDAQQLNVQPPTHTPKATDYIDQMISFIQQLEARGFTYQANGNLYFDTSKDPHYGALRGYREVANAQSRIADDQAKRSNSDFVLWFTQSKFSDHAMQWQSPWGLGYPGWHLECSAISQALLGERFDLHCGGVDHIAVHHTNEMAQNYGCCQQVGARYWLHSEFLVLPQQGKMSKSSGDFLTLSRLKEQGYHPLAYRYFVLQSHYRKPLTFHEEALNAAQQAWRRLRLRSQELYRVEPLSSTAARQWVEQGLAKVSDDFNSPELLALLWQALKNNDLELAEKRFIVDSFDQVLGLALLDQNLEIDQGTGDSLSVDEVEWIEQQVQARLEAKRNKDFTTADAIRTALAAKGIILLDGVGGTTWQRED